MEETETVLGMISSFFENGIEYVEDDEILDSYKNAVPIRIKGRNRILDNLVLPEHFDRKPLLHFVGEPNNKSTIDRLKAFLKQYNPPKITVRRKFAPMPVFNIKNNTSNPFIHTIYSKTIVSGWIEVIHRCYTHGVVCEIKNTKRKEIQNLKVVVDKPFDVVWENIEMFGFTKEAVLAYQQEILRSAKQEDVVYTYGERMLSYFGINQIEEVVSKLKKNKEDRKCYVCVWDVKRDITTTQSVPCLVSLFFRVVCGKLTVTAVFRTHNALDAWLLNAFGIAGILEHVSVNTSIPPGALTIFSHSISIHNDDNDRIEHILKHREFTITPDPLGCFRIHVDGGFIIVSHYIGDCVNKIYKGKSAAKLQTEIARDAIVSDINHAIYIGRQLQKAELCIKHGSEFIQD